METPSTVFSNNSTTAHHILEHIRPQKFTARPHNRFSPEFSEWYLYPAEKDTWPAYPLSKLSIHTKTASANSTPLMFAGFYVEKGYSPDLPKELQISKTFIMQPDWEWYNLLRKRPNANLENTLREVLTRSRCAMQVLIDIHAFNDPPKYDTEKTPSDDSMQFTIFSENLKLNIEQMGKKDLKALNDCTQIEQVLERLNNTDFQCYWANVAIGILLSYQSDSHASWSAAEIWNNALEPWTAWL